MIHISNLYDPIESLLSTKSIDPAIHKKLQLGEDEVGWSGETQT